MTTDTPATDKRQLQVTKPQRLLSSNYRPSPASTFHLHTGQAILEKLLGRPPSQSIMLRRALEVYATHLSKIRTASGEAREVKAVLAHVRAS